MLFLSGMATLAAVLIPQVFGHMIDRITHALLDFKAGRLDLEGAMAERNRGLLLLLALGFGPLVGAFYPWLRMRMNLLFERILRERFFRLVMERDSDFFLKLRTGDLVTRLTDNLRSNPSGLPWLLCSGIFRALTAVGIILCCVVGMLFLNVKLALAAVIPLPLMLGLFLFLQTTMEKRCDAVQEKVSDTTAFLESAFSGIRILKSFTAEHPHQLAFRDLLGRRADLEMEQARTEGLFQVYFEFLSYLGEILVLVLGGILVVRGSLTIGAYYAFFSYLGMVLPLVMDIPMLLVTLSQGCVIIDRLEELEGERRNVVRADSPPDIASAGPVSSEEFESLRFENVGFVFPCPAETGNRPPPRRGSPFDLRGITFELKRGETIAVMGPIGSGKTTLLQLAAGLLKAGEGKVVVNGKPLDDSRMQWWRRRIGFVQQEAVAFSESIRDNIDFWRNHDFGRIEAVSRLALIHDEVSAMPGGFDELLGARGTGLSGGQRQRLSLARALVGNPEVLLMDDVTAGLDADNERKLWRRLRSDSPGLSCLIVTHRAATARVADRVMVIEAGRIVDIGTHDSLSRTCPLYRELTGRAMRKNEDWLAA